MINVNLKQTVPGLLADFVNTDSIKLPAVFRAEDLAQLDRASSIPGHLRVATRQLVAMVQDEAQYEADRATPWIGRFDLNNFSRSADEAEAVFRLCFSALRFLFTDYRACEASMARFMGNELKRFQEINLMRAADADLLPLGGAAPYDGPIPLSVGWGEEKETQEVNAEEAPEVNAEEAPQKTWGDLAKALRSAASFAESVGEGCGIDWAANECDAAPLSEALKFLLGEGVEWLREEFTELLDQSINDRRTDADILGKLHLPKEGEPKNI